MRLEKRKTAARAALVGLLAVTALFRSGSLPFFSSFGGAFLFLPFLVTLSMFETPIASCVFGILAGALWDFSSPLADGVLTLFCGLCALLVCLCVKFFLRARLPSALAAGGTVFLLAALLLTLLSVSDPDGRQRIFSFYYLPAGLIALLITPLDFWIVKKLFYDPREDRVM